jgi:hypothetical protein
MARFPVLLESRIHAAALGWILAFILPLFHGLSGSSLHEADLPINGHLALQSALQIA